MSAGVSGTPARSSGPTRRIAFLGLVLAIVVGALLIALTTRGSSSSPTATPGPSAAFEPYEYLPSEPAPSLSLTNQTGSRFSLEDLRGRTAFVSFGYTHCPDVCPTTLAIDRDVIRARPDKVSVVFVTIDPARDTADKLGDYLALFEVPMTGLTGTDAEIAETASRWGVAYAKEPGGSADSYAMAHTAGTFVIDPAGRLRYLYPYGTPAADLIQAVDTLEQGG